MRRISLTAMGLVLLVGGLAVAYFSIKPQLAKKDTSVDYTSGESEDCVILMHGLARTSASMEALQFALVREGYSVANIDYPSRHYGVSKLSQMNVEAGLDACGAMRTHFVTHSLGGVLVRYYLEHNEIRNLGRVVMLAPPNQGSQVVDNWRDVPGFSLLNGPAGLELGTDSSSILYELGPIDFDLGVIAGTKSVNLILSLSLPNPDDGKVSVENTKVSGMSDFITVPHSLPFIMNSDLVAEQTISFLKHGRFSR